jgi:Hydantoinase/oxoprolinase
LAAPCNVVTALDPQPVRDALRAALGADAESTATDANVVLGRLDPARFLGGEMPLDTDSAARAIGLQLATRLGLSTDAAAQAVIDVAVNKMALAVRAVSIERGLDPRDCALVAFGGAGPLHAVAIARDLDIPTVIIPPLPGHYSACGMLTADVRHDYVRTCYGRLDELPAGFRHGRGDQHRGPLRRRPVRHGRRDAAGQRGRPGLPHQRFSMNWRPRLNYPAPSPAPGRIPPSPCATVPEPE